MLVSRFCEGTSVVVARGFYDEDQMQLTGSNPQNFVFEKCNISICLGFEFRL